MVSSPRIVTHQIGLLGPGGWVIFFFFSLIQDLVHGLQEFVFQLHQGDDLTHCLFLMNDLW